MNDATIKRLNEINREFYRITAESFDESRGRSWPGWEVLLPYLKLPLTVLDIGCGNGRFGVFLAQKLGADLVYRGMDSSSALLERARAALSGLEARLEHRDVIENPPDTGEYDVVALFGVLHHVPGNWQRQEFMRALAQRVAPGGYLAFAVWRFYDYERFRQRIVPWPSDLDADPGDCLLDWRRGVHALRYCHYVDDAEHKKLIAATGLAEIITYRADGRTSDLNQYSLLRRDPA